MFLVVRVEKLVRHYKIRQSVHGAFCLVERASFPSLKDLVLYYRDQYDGLCCKLEMPCVKLDLPSVQSISHTTVDHLEIDPCSIQKVRPLGSGRFGTVWLGLWNGTTEVAVKELQVTAESLQKTLYGEAETMWKLSHEKLLKLYAVCLQTKPVFIVTEYMPQGTLKKYLQAHQKIKDLPFLQMVDFAVQEDYPAVRTSDYVQKQIPAADTFSSDVQPNIAETSKSAQPMVPVSPTAPAETQAQRRDAPLQEQSPPQDDRKAHSSLPPQFKQQSSESPKVKPQLNPAATSFYPRTIHPSISHSLYARGAPQATTVTRSADSDMSEFARFMVSRELISTSLSKFDDHAENYRAWKATFKASIADLNLTAEQELDLMVKWLGPESTNRIKSLRTVYVGQAEAGLAVAWQRLERTYGSAEAIEKSLFKRLQNVPRINHKEADKVLDLSDLDCHSI
ncbi:unnamed protein product [Ranitomeya imitator]|uniref:Non-specific protein-tyrosine kinase n=1 Tax=Ranitomeya imitator TaxID=111125 RepID=A0ABN9LT64_9NEOB|nr:unnamed protein product [Ranitomeya imitator]